MCNFWSWSTYINVLQVLNFLVGQIWALVAKKQENQNKQKKNLLFLQSWWVIFLEKASIQVLQQYSYPHTFYNNIPQVWFSLRKFFLLKNPENFSPGSFDFFLPSHVANFLFTLPFEPAVTANLWVLQFGLLTDTQCYLLPLHTPPSKPDTNQPSFSSFMTVIAWILCLTSLSITFFIHKHEIMSTLWKLKRKHISIVQQSACQVSKGWHCHYSCCYNCSSLNS